MTFTNNDSNNNKEDASSSENSVTVAAILSALRVKPQENGVPKKEVQNTEEDQSSNGSYPSSPTSESPEVVEVSETTATTGDDIFKMYTCRYCGKKFDRAFSCNRHERVHTGFKPCFCCVCGRGFSEPRNLRHHVIRFHSDGALRHLIKRDRRKRKDEYANPDIQRTEEFDNARLSKVLKETNCPNVTISDGIARWQQNTIENGYVNPNQIKIKPEDKDAIQSTLVQGNPNNISSMEIQNTNNSPAIQNNTYSANLTKIIATSLDSNTKTIPNKKHRQNLKSPDELEPGEIRLDVKTKIIDDGERGRRLVSVDEQGSEEGSDHSPQFSSYAPRLNIIQHPVDRNKALLPITDDIGRTFFECPYCQKLFGSTSDMNRHLDFHEDLRPYNCEYCDYSARTNSQLKVHKMRHEGNSLNVLFYIFNFVLNLDFKLI